jgi:hypothetical protein
MSNGKTSRSILYWVNALLLALSLIAAGFAGYALASPAHVADFLSVLVPKSAFYALLAFTGALAVITSLAVCAAKTRSKLGLGIYIVINLACLLVELALAFYVFTTYGVINDAKAQEFAADMSTQVGRFEVDIVKFAQRHPTEWVETQDALECCGYDAATSGMASIDTGAACATDGPDNFCKELLLSKLEGASIYVAASAGALAFVQLLCMGAAARLACCVKREGTLLDEWFPTADEVAGTQRDVEVGNGGAPMAHADGAPVTYA